MRSRYNESKLLIDRRVKPGKHILDSNFLLCSHRHTDIAQNNKGKLEHLVHLNYYEIFQNVVCFAKLLIFREN